MHGDAVVQIAKLATEATGKVVEIDDKTYATTPLYDPRKAEPLAEPLVVHTLTGLRDFLHACQDPPHHAMILPARVAVHVVDPTQVRLVGPLMGPFRQRETLVDCRCFDRPVPPFGKYLDQEAFITWMYTGFVQGDVTGQLVKIVGNVQDQAVRLDIDDGVTQVATVRQGVQKLGAQKLPNPVRLAPWRTFPEIQQPASPFVFRARSGAKDGDVPTFALFPSDDVKWKEEAIQSIAAWLGEAIAATDDSVSLALYA